MLKKWDELPKFMKTPEIFAYWEILNNKRGQLLLKRMFDLVFAVLLLTILAIPMFLIAILIICDSEGPVFYVQERVTTYGRHFNMHKFRTMVSNADKIGTPLTIGADPRITCVGAKLRRFRLDELPQVLDVIKGDMSFVGTRPEVVKYVEKYLSEWNATLLMPAGITSEASIRFKDEEKLLTTTLENVEEIYLKQILPVKMQYNLKSIKQFNLIRDLQTMLRTITAVFGNYGD